MVSSCGSNRGFAFLPLPAGRGGFQVPFGGAFLEPIPVGNTPSAVLGFPLLISFSGQISANAIATWGWPWK